MSTSIGIMFLIMFLEGLNLTGIPAVVILPTLGVLTAQGNRNIVGVLVITILGSIAGNVTYYLVVRLVGARLYDWLYKKFKGIRKSLDKAQVLVEKYGNGACCIGRVIPGVRTVISLFAGTFKVGFVQFLVYSTLGIIVWNSVLVLAGYTFSA